MSAFTTADLDRINTAIATGELTIEKDGKRITYRSVADLRAAREIIIADLAQQGLSPQRPRVTVAYFDRG
ncbi:phage head-tail joining protein [Cupriavidus malaysiensis]|uniref:Uncharacterized protein n=1 Tax=Cupriavidus malaysiensis TaxID=367825 RepID=A0ABM6F436_9BURK|nr:hypothetical protein [Cupriavidus malaysiensis]AOZ05957.1 hypothetical protein BKK80_09045 [Cupriavidus malaysiensis]